MTRCRRCEIIVGFLEIAIGIAALFISGIPKIACIVAITLGCYFLYKGFFVE